MSEVDQKLKETLSPSLSDRGLDLIDVIKIPKKGGTQIIAQTLDDIFSEFDRSDEGAEVSNYVLRVRSSKVASPTPSFDLESGSGFESIYLPDGALNADYLQENARLLMESREYALARKIYKTLLDSPSGTVKAKALVGIGDSYDAEGKRDEAFSSYEESITFHPSVGTFQKIARILIAQGRDRFAAEVLERAAALKGTANQVQFELHKAAGNCWLKAGDTHRAEISFKKSLELHPSSDEARANLGTLYLKSNKITEALRCFDDAVATNPKNAKALFGIAWCAHIAQDKKRAYEYFVRSLIYDINNPAAIFQMVKYAYDLKSYTAAEKLLSRYVESAPINPNLLYCLAGLRYHLGKSDEALHVAKQVLSIRPNHHGASELVRILSENGVKEDAWKR